MLDFTNSCDHGALKKTTNLKVLLDVLWPLFSVTSAPHGNFYVQVFFIESIMDLSMLKSLRSWLHYGIAPMELLSYRFFLNGLKTSFASKTL